MRAMLFAASMPFILATTAAHAAISVAGNANPFLAGQPNGTPCCSGDGAPVESPVLAMSGALGGNTYVFSATGGTMNFPGPVNPTADGAGALNMTADYGTGISGALGVNINGLVGVFLDSLVPGGPAPVQRNDGMAFAAIAPLLGQIFWIGDGLTGTGSGTLQQFTAPSGASRLFLGTSDGFGWYNNVGTIDVNIRQVSTSGSVPEPTSWAMMLTGFALLGTALRRSRRTARVRYT